jgi:hypothetical protein
MDQTMDKGDDYAPNANIGTINQGTSAPVVAGNDANRGNEKCCYHSCKLKGAVKLKCSASNCEKEVHTMCFQGNLIMKHKLDPLPLGGAVYTKKCYERALKEQSGADDGRGKWHNDGKKGPDDEHTSIRILLNWWMEEGNYSRYCGKNNGGVTKKQFAAKLAEKISTETNSNRDAKSVVNKIRHIEDSWRRAHIYATSETGAGVQELQGEATFQDCVKERCPYYYDLLEVMQDRASSQPKCTSDELDDNSDSNDSDDDDDGNDRNDNDDDASKVLEVSFGTKCWLMNI